MTANDKTEIQSRKENDSLIAKKKIFHRTIQRVRHIKLNT